jgi:sugar lactone lactonase YvrE
VRETPALALPTITTVTANGARPLPSHPSALAVDAAGNLFIADDHHNQVFRLDQATGLVSVVAGNGGTGDSGDGGPATQAELNSPEGLAVDGAGNLFIADQLNNCVREVHAGTGIITTVAGLPPESFGFEGLTDGGIDPPFGPTNQGYNGDNIPATSALLNTPASVAVDVAGNLFIADFGNNRIRKVDHSTGVITTVAGNGSQGYGGDNGPAVNAALNQPADMVVDDSGNLFIADAGNNRVREVSKATGVITTIAGTGTAGFSGDGGPATAARLNIPASLALSQMGNLFIADVGNNCVREMNLSSGTITTFAGNGMAGDTGDNGPPTEAKLNAPDELALASTGELFLLNTGDNVIRQISPVDISDNPTPDHLVVTAPGSATAGSPFTFKVQAVDAFNHVDAHFSGIVHFISSDPHAVLPDDVQLTGGTGTFTATLKTAGSNSLTASNAVRGLTASATVNVSAAAASSFLVAVPSTATAGVSFGATVTAVDAFGNTATSYHGTVRFGSSDAHAVLPANTTLANGAGRVSVTLKTAGSDTVTVTDTASGIKGKASVAVGAAAAAKLVISAGGPVTAGAAFSVTVTAKDAFGNIATGYAGTVGLTSTDARATLPASYAFQTTDKGVHVFTATLRTAGAQTVTAANSKSASLKATASVSVQPAAAVRLSVTRQTVTATAGAGVRFTVTALDPFGNTAKGYRGVVQLKSSDGKAVLPDPLHFTKDDAGVKHFVVAFRTAGTQTVTVSDRSAGLSGSASVTVRPAALSKLVLTGPTAVKADTPATYTLTAVDAFGNTVAGYRGTVRWQSSDAHATLPAAYTFTATDQGSHKFTVTFASKKKQSLTATDKSNPALSGSETGIVVS